jgi:hypothetical protein
MVYLIVKAIDMNCCPDYKNESAKGDYRRKNG